MTWQLYVMISKGQETTAVTRLDGKSSLEHVNHLKHELGLKHGTWHRERAMQHNPFV